jgi:prophage regulatory protein
MQTNPPTSYNLPAKKVCEILGISNASLYDRIAPASPRFDSSFPRPIKLGKSPSSASRWSPEEISRWISQRVAESHQKKPRGTNSPSSS